MKVEIVVQVLALAACSEALGRWQDAHWGHLSHGRPQFGPPFWSGHHPPPSPPPAAPSDKPDTSTDSITETTTTITRGSFGVGGWWPNFGFPHPTAKPSWDAGASQLISVDSPSQSAAPQSSPTNKASQNSGNLSPTTKSQSVHSISTASAKSPSHIAITSSRQKNNPLGIATKTWGVPDSYGGVVRPTNLPANIPHQPTYGNTSASTSDDAKHNPGFSNGPSHRGHWQSGYDINTNPDSKWPDTGVTRKWTLRIQNTTLSPIGIPKQMLVVNGQFPGPLIEANWGDILEITVINELENNGTSIHWHGFRQTGYNCEDGVGGITECPIAPGHSKTYKFQATSFGTTWYHSHFSAQYGDGVLGPVIIHGPASANYDIDLGHVIVNDYYNATAFVQDYFTHRNGPGTASNYLLNGKNIALDGSSGERAQWKFQKGKKHLLRFINTSIDMMFKIQIDGHKLQVISNDFVPIQPFTVSELSIGIGQRYDVIVEADQAVSNYYLRAFVATDCAENLNDGTGTANGIISYEGASSSLPFSNFTTPSTTCFDFNATSLIPIVAEAVDPTGFADKFGSLPVTVNRVALQGGDNVFLWYLNGITQDIDWANPTIEQAVQGNLTFPDARHVVTLSDPDVWTFWVIQNQFFVPHPMHLHGHDFALLGQGSGTFDPATDLDLLNFENPTRRDVAMLIASGWTVIAFKTDNPGSWLMHCHIAFHAGEGLSLQFLERPDDIPAKYGSLVNGDAFQDNCKAWREYEYGGGMVYNKSDSGLRKRHEHMHGRMDVVRHLHGHKRTRF